MRHHLLIGGTGRAGTTFLVKYLAACGLETHLAKHPDALVDENANAGLEDSPFGDADRAYVLKSPWMYEYVDRLLADQDIALDGVIIPMRGLVEAATSRVLNELRARYANEALPDDLTLWESWGTTAGGVTYSLNPIDQARLLALGFHELMNALVKHDIPVVLLDFPRFIDDADYLHRKLQPLLGVRVGHAEAMEAHRALVDPAKFRVGRELAEDAAACTPADVVTEAGLQRPALAFPPHAVLDRVALKRELDRIRECAAQYARQLAEAESRVAASMGMVEGFRDDVATLQTCVAEEQQKVTAALAGETAMKQRSLLLMRALDEAQTHIGKLLASASDDALRTAEHRREREGHQEEAALHCSLQERQRQQLEQQLRQLEEQRDQLAQQCGQLEIQRSQLERRHVETEDMRQEAVRQQVASDWLRQRVTALENSRSWRITAPVRAVSRLFGRR